MESQVKNGSMNQEKRLDEDEANSEEENRLKNRYLNVSAFSHSRIRITGSNDGSDGYINANYIDVTFFVILISHIYVQNNFKLIKNYQ